MYKGNLLVVSAGAESEQILIHGTFQTFVGQLVCVDQIAGSQSSKQTKEVFCAASMLKTIRSFCLACGLVKLFLIHPSQILPYLPTPSCGT